MILFKVFMVVTFQIKSQVWVAHHNTLWLHPTRLPCPWNSPGKNTRLGCYSFLQGIFPIQGSNPACLHCRQIMARVNYCSDFWLLFSSTSLIFRVIWIEIHISYPFYLAYFTQYCFVGIVHVAYICSLISTVVFY